jgi:hypothetical protein
VGLLRPADGSHRVDVGGDVRDRSGTSCARTPTAGGNSTAARSSGSLSLTSGPNSSAASLQARRLPSARAGDEHLHAGPDLDHDRPMGDPYPRDPGRRVPEHRTEAGAGRDHGRGPRRTRPALDATLPSWLPMTRTGAGLYRLGQLTALWPYQRPGGPSPQTCRCGRSPTGSTQPSPCHPPASTASNSQLDSRSPPTCTCGSGEGTDVGGGCEPTDPLLGGRRSAPVSAADWRGGGHDS